MSFSLILLSSFVHLMKKQRASCFTHGKLILLMNVVFTMTRSEIENDCDCDLEDKTRAILRYKTLHETWYRRRESWRNLPSLFVSQAFISYFVFSCFLSLFHILFFFLFFSLLGRCFYCFHSIKRPWDKEKKWRPESCLSKIDW